MKMNNAIYLDFQASTPVDKRVLAAMTPFYRESFGNPHSADHILGWQAHEAVERSAALIASLLGMSSDEIVFTSGATEANNHAILGAAIAARGSSRNRIIVSSIDHKCVLAAAQAAQDLFGFVVEIAPVDARGFIDLEWLERSLNDDVLLVSVIAVNNEIGTIQDIEAIADAVHRVGAMFHSDCAQAPIATSMEDIAAHVDMLSLSGHKIYGPKGIGALFINRSIRGRVSPIIFGGGQQQNLRSGTVPTPLAVGMGEAARLLDESDIAAERDRMRSLRGKFIACLQKAGVQVIRITPSDTFAHPGNTNLRFVGVNAQDLLQSIQPYVAASTGSACTSGIPEASHVLRAVGLSETDAEECIRFSLGIDTNESDVEEGANIIVRAITGLLAS